jgi:hypothetical protein
MTAPIVADVAGWTSQGCFLDNVDPYHLLPTTNSTSNALTPDACGTFCAGYTYFGLESSEYLPCKVFTLAYCGRYQLSDLLLRRRTERCPMQLSGMAQLLRW